MAAIF